MIDSITIVYVSSTICGSSRFLRTRRERNCLKYGAIIVSSYPLCSTCVCDSVYINYSTKFVCPTKHRITISLQQTIMKYCTLVARCTLFLVYYLKCPRCFGYDKYKSSHVARQSPWHGHKIWFGMKNIEIPKPFNHLA